MKTRKRILAAVLTAIMMISMLPANTFATETVGNGEAESAVEAVSMSSEEHEVETTVEDVSEEKTDESSEVVQADETADPAAVEEVETVSEEETEAAGDAEAVTETAEAASEPVTLTASTKEYTVKVTYDPATAEIPADAEVSVEEILEKDKVYDTYVEQAADAIESDVDSLNYVKLLDISIVNAEKTPVEPSSPVDVQICLKDVDEVQDNTQVVHFGKESTDVIEPDVKGNEVSFETDGFSIYAVIGTDNYARLTVNFYGAKDAATGKYTLIDTMYVKRGDQSSADRIKQIVYDPGAGTIPSGYGFYGWSIGEEDYSIAVDGSTEGSSIEDVRTYIQGYTIPDGDTAVLNIYAMMATHYTVKYIDLDGLSLGTDTALVKTAGEDVSYTVNMNYSPDSEHDFDGWFVHEGLDNISDPSDVTGETIFPNETVIKIKGNVEFSVSAPEGHWLIFDENGKHATYNAPRFVRGGSVTTAEGMLEMTRNGYYFDGWWTGAPTEEGGDPSGERFEFGHELSSTTTVYAKWNPEGEADYTIIIWKEGVEEETWDFEDILTLKGTPGQIINTVSPQGKGNDRYARINGEDKKYEGFSYFDHDKDVKIAPEGDSVVNVYYKRNTYTLRFQSSISIPIFGHFTFREITARYGVDISSYFPIKTAQGFGPFTDLIAGWFNSLVRWEPQNGTTFDKAVVYIDTMPAESITFYTNRSLASEKEMYYYVEALPGETSDRTFQGKDFVLLSGPLGARYNYFTYAEDFMEINGYDKFGSEPSFDGQEAVYGDTLRCYYTRKLETINYMDGSYFDGNNVRMSTGSGQLDTATGIPYGSDITSYNKGGENYIKHLPKDKVDYVFEGWFIDKTCTSPYTFDRMPAGTINVYAKWRQIEYRVFLRPNAGMDASLNWGSDAQKMNFRVAYGDKVSLPEGTRTGYKFYGWYKDSALQTPVYATSYVMNETTVWDDYDKTKEENMTDPNDKWGTYGTSNEDEALERWWITKRLELFAKWGRITVGADGIGIIYDSGVDGTVPPTDKLLYQDNTNAVAGASPKANPGKVFEKWIVQKWDGSKFVDTGVEVLPGKKFSVNIEDAKIEDDETGEIVPIADVVANKHYTYTIQVRAEYSDAEEVVPTHITWYKNDGSGKSYRSDDNIKINEAVDVYGLGEGEEIPSREGFTFLGWTKAYESVGPETSETDLFITYDETNGYDIAQVAADEITPYEALYAVWEEKNEYFIYHHYVGGEAVDYLETCAIPESGTVNLAKDKMTGGYMYGGYWDYTGKVKGDPITDSGLTFAPTKHQYIYLKEVSTDYLKPNFYVIYNEKTHKGLIQKIFVMYDVDKADDYLHHYLVIDGDETNKVEITNFASEGITVTSEGKFFEKLTAYDLFKVDSADMGFTQLDSEQYIVLGKQIDVSAYYVTKDNVKVTGAKNRRILLTSTEAYNGKPTFTGWKSQGGNTRIGIVNVASTATAYGSAKMRSFSVMPTMMIEAPSEKLEYTITKVYDTGTEEEIFEEGDYTGAVSYSSKDGYLFAGWYMDSAFTTPADFSNVNSDMTVYAKYVKKTDISVSFTRKSLKSGTAVFDAVVSVKGQSDLDSVTVNTKGSDAVLADRTVQKSGSGKNIRYTTQYKGNAAVNGLSLIDFFTASVRWTTPDGTAVSGPAFKCTYIMGRVTVR